MHLYLLGKMRKARRFIWGDNVLKQADRGFSGILSDFELCIYTKMPNPGKAYMKECGTQNKNM